MAYIGRNPAIGTQKVLDSLESQFNGTLTTFDLRYNSNTIYPPIASALIVSLGGVLQEPGEAYTVASDTITFASAPPTGTDCWILLYTEFGGAAGATANLTVSNNLTIGNELHGPANFVIDPATIGDNTGTVEIKGNLTVQGTQTTVNSTTVDLDHLSLGDNEIANFGDGNDLKIWHNGSNSIINDEGTGELYLGGNTNINITNAALNEFKAKFITDGAVELYYDNSKKFETTSTGITVTGLTNTDTLNVTGFSTFNDDARIIDDKKLRFGTSGSGILQIYTNGTNSFFKQTSGDLKYELADQFIIQKDDGDEPIAVFTADESVDLYYDNSKKFETTSTGVTVTGTVVADGLSLGDNEIAKFGDGDDLKIYHDGTNSAIQNTTGYLYVYGGTNNIYLKAKNDEDGIVVKPNDSVELYYDNSKKIETTSTGVTVTGALEVSAATNITVGGTALPSLTGLLGGSLDGTLGTVTMAYLPSAPNSPVQGQFYFNSLNQKAQIYTGSAFVDLVPSGGGGGGGAGTTDAQATFRKYTYTLTSTTNAISGSSDTVVTAGNFVVGNVYTIKTIGTTDFTAIGASANTVGVQFTATGAGTGTGDAYDTLYYATSGIQNIEVYVNGVKSVEGSSNDYVATTGTSVNFTSNLASGDVVDIQVYELLTNDAYVLASGGTFTGNVGINTSTINNRLHIHSDANEQGILLTQGGSNYSSIVADADRSSADLYILEILAKWNGTKAAQITLESGDDTTNKDDGRIKFSTSAAGGSLGIAMRIEPDGKVGIGGDHNPLSPLHVKVNTATLLRLERDGNANATIRYENDTSAMHAGLSTSATFFGIGTSENIGSSATQFCVTRANGNVGIGNTAPVNRLQVSGGDATFDNNTYIGFNIYNNNGWYQSGTGNGAVLKHHSTNGFQIYTGADSGNGAGSAASVSARLTVSDTGNVGVGTATPSQKFHVQGNSYFTGNVEFDGKLFNDSLNQTPASGAGAINLKPSASGGSTGIIFDSNVNNNSDFGYIWWYDENDNYNTRTDTNSENGVLVIGVANDGANGAPADAIAIESWGNIFLNPGVDGVGGSDTLDFAQGKVYIGNSTTKYEVWHEGNDSSLMVDNQGFTKTLGNVTFNDSVALQFGTGGLDTSISYDGTDDLLNVGLKSGAQLKFYDLSDTDNSISVYLQTGTAQIADTFADTTTDKKYIYFSNPNSSNDPGFIMHETSNSEINEGVLHLCPSDDNAPGDYVSIHGTNDPDALRLHTDGSINTGSAHQLVLSSGSGDVKVDDNLEVTGTLEISGDLIYNNNAIVASYPDANNIDHIWHSDSAFAGTGGVWNFCSDTTYKNTGNSGIRMGGKLGVGATPSNNPANLNAFIALGDTDTGIGQDGDGELEFWANNQEILHLNTGDVNLLKNFRCGGGSGLPGYNNTTNGVYIERNNGSIFAYRSTGFGLHLGRSNNGEVIRIKKNNSTQAGTLQITSNSTVALQNGSDYRLKTNIEQIPNAVSSFRQLKPCQFEYISEPGEIFQGFIAHELQEVNPKFASGVKDEVDENGDIVEQGVDTRNLVPLLTAALQEAFNMIDNLQEQINQLSNP